MVLGYVGRNAVIIHKRQVFRCAPEQLRPSTQDEKKLVETPQMEFLGIKHLIETNQLASRQFIDLVPDSYPSHPEESDLAPPPVSAPATQEPQSISDRVSVPMPVDAPQTVVPEPPQSEFVHKSWVLPEEPQTEQPKPVSAESELAYGPVRQPRRRIHQKDGPMALYRPGPMLQEDFQEMMQEIVPELVNQVLSEEAASDPSHASSSASQPSRGVKRSIDGADDTTAEPADKRPAFDPPDEALFAEPTGQTFACDEMAVCSVELLDKHQVPQASDSLFLEDKKALVRLFREGAPHEVMVAAYMKKKSSKEIPAFGNPPDIQKKVDEAKVLEWGTITAKHAGRPVLGPEADEVRKHLSHRIMGSRFVMTIKHEDGADPRMKARWCLLGHLDPDLTAKAEIGDLQSPTLSQVGRNLVFQLIASNRWRMALGDVKGAFLSAGNLPKRYRPLYARLPPGGIPGLPDDALIEVVGHVYGLNDSPAAWYKKLCQELLQVGFERSQFDSCLFYFREKGKLTGIYGVHVDDCVTGGDGVGYQQAIQKLQSTFEFRKWRTGSGDFCGAQYTQCDKTCEITMSQSQFVEKIRPLHLTRERCQEKTSPLTDKEISCLRAINGSLNWLANQSRPDLATQVSFSQLFPKPTVADAIAANQAIRRARQHADQTIRFCCIEPESLGLMCHSDAAFGNAKAGATQAGFIVSFTHKAINDGADTFLEGLTNAVCGFFLEQRHHDLQ